MAFGDKRLFIAKRIKVENDEFGNEISYYETPKEYGFSYMPTSGQVDYQIYGELISNMFTSILPMRRAIPVMKLISGGVYIPANTS